jgi:hypothetical protein
MRAAAALVLARIEVQVGPATGTGVDPMLLYRDQAHVK